jgi:hypothetical protein
MSKENEAVFRKVFGSECYERSLEVGGGGIPDATRDYSVFVTEQDIERGVPGDPCKCPIALGWKRATGFRPIVNKKNVYIKIPRAGGEIIVRTTAPVATRKFIEAVDAGEEVSPGEYRIYRVSPSNTRKRKRAKNRMNGNYVNRPKRRDGMKQATVTVANSRELDAELRSRS